MPFETDSISQIVLKSESLNLAKLNEQESFTALKQYLGPVQFDLDIMARQNKLFPPGLINILSASDYLGSVLTIECVEDLTHPEKKGQVTYSGNLKNIILESITIARLNAYRYLSKSQQQEINEKNIHFHFMEASSQKDGPSGGCAICTALLSFALKKSVPS